MAHRMRTLLAVAVIGLTLAACGGSSSSGSSASTTSSGGQHPAVVVTLKFVSFEPAHVTVHVGQSVEWMWEDAPIAHNVTFAGFASATQPTGTYFHTFTQAGNYSYRCTIHANMSGVVTVLP
ncbi:MAG TPA: plastocyanin/azurin family copper-binding protein [Acidimicrobiales bacterium]|nr:plastocyanin/azurin family copper-binding protein [Acidimicrobiales bacterium]